MKLPINAADAHATLAAACNTGDVETVMGMYDVNGIICPEPGKAAIEAILSIPGKMEIKTVYCLETGDTGDGR